MFIQRLFAEGTPARSFELVSAKAMPTGSILSTYNVAGPLTTVQFDTATPRHRDIVSLWNGTGALKQNFAAS